MVTLMRHRQTKGPVSARPHLNRRATPRLHQACAVCSPGMGILSVIGILRKQRQCKRFTSAHRSVTDPSVVLFQFGVKVLREATNDVAVLGLGKSLQSFCGYVAERPN